MPALPVRAGIVDVVFMIMMHIHRFPTNRTAWIFFFPRTPGQFVRMVFSPLMLAFLALILLVSMRILSVAIKVRFVVALRAA